MKLIAHRGLIDGPSTQFENQPNHVQSTLNKGYDCEVDLWVFDNRLYLGHDGPHYDIKEEFLSQPGLWIHCKNLPALEYCIDNVKLNYFWHEKDSYTLTSKGYIWAYPEKKLNKWSIMLMPEWSDPDLNNTVGVDCFGICSDFILKIKDKIKS